MEVLFEQKNKGNKWISVLTYTLIAVLVLLIIFFNMVVFCGIVGSSMDNALADGQHVLLLKGKTAKKGDIIVFARGDKNLIKRVIATQNQRLVFVTDGDEEYVRLYTQSANGYKKAEDESFKMLYEKFKYSFNKFVKGTFKVYHCDEFDDVLYGIDAEYIIKVDKNCYFVMGDNRDNSSDSRDFGFVKKSAVVGRLAYKLKKGSFSEKLFLGIYGKKTPVDGCPLYAEL